MLTGEDTAEKQLNLAQQRGERLKRLRGLLRLSRKSLSELYDIPAGTIQNWEDARHGGLTEKGAQRFIEVLKAEKVDCKLEWLLFGIGNPPDQLTASRDKRVSQKVEINREAKELDNIAKELTLFYEHNTNAVDFFIPDNAMDPQFLLGDHVAGKRYFNEDIVKLIGHACITQTQTGLIIVRTLLLGSKPGQYDLIAVNKQAKQEDLDLYDVRIFSAAPILWIRRANPVTSS